MRTTTALALALLLGGCATQADRAAQLESYVAEAGRCFIERSAS